ncbi:MAG: helix-hairpin-helix domain-containing protein [Bacteroidales bacterium]|jgi:DNA uptake protein ComE-like DNA-binding protein|nr:helix-hairpin-helix domain-containing protein [Bacteroidales bacterium]
MSLWNKLKKYLDFSRSERSGILLLCGLILVTLALKIYLPGRNISGETDFSAYEREIALFFQSVDSLQAAVPAKGGNTDVAYFYFDPNTVSDVEWKQLGLNERQVRNIRNYQAKGGHFRRKEDVKRLYTLPATMYETLEPYIRIAEQRSATGSAPARMLPQNVETSFPVREKSVRILELNAADSVSLVQLPGIGPVIAARIVRYRRLIGGFSAIAQLNEVYGIDSTLVSRLEDRLSADSSMIRKITINVAGFGELATHPYLTDEQVRGILYYRRLQKSIATLDELVANNILSLETAQRVAPYLSFEK